MRINSSMRAISHKGAKAMSKSRRYEIPELYPQPKQITLTEGESTLSTDIRLGTFNVLPLQRKAIRSILTSSGVKVVANKKLYVVNVCVETPEAFDLSDVPESSRGEYYEIRIQGAEVTISAPYQVGTTWATHTLVGLFRHFSHGNKIPNMIIRDWPSLPNRGIFVESKWGPDRMTLQDWYQTIDSIASVKMNVLGVGLYGCWGSCRYEGVTRLTEFLMVSVPEHEELNKQHHLCWYSPREKAWQEADYKEFSRENDFFGDVVAYGKERGVTVIPFVNSLGHNTFFPRMMPELSAKNADGKPTANGYCLSSPEVRKFIEDFYTSIIERYYPNGCDFFHVQLDEIGETRVSPEDPLKNGSPWCQCPKCAKKSREALLSEYVIWLTKMLVSKGVGKVLLWNDMMTSSMSLMTKEFVKKLDVAGLKDRLILDCWDYANIKLNPKRNPSYARKVGVASWVTPMTCYFDWAWYNYHIPNIDLMMQLGRAEKSVGAISYSVHNPSHLDHEALLAGYAWEDAPNTDSKGYLQRWMFAHFDGNAKLYERAISLMKDVTSTDDFGFCWNYGYTYCSADHWPRPYPAEALEKFEAREADSIGPLNKKAEQAAEADAIILKLLETEKLGEDERDCLKSLRAEANRMLFYAKGFAWLLQLRKELASGAVKKSQAAACGKLRDELLGHLAIVEANSPTWLVPATMQGLSPLYEFFNRLEKQLQEFAGRKKGNSIIWAAPEDLSVMI